MSKIKFISNILEKELKISAKEIKNLIKKKNQNQLALGVHPNWDSLNHVRILTKIEKKFGIEINAKNVKKFASFKNIIKSLK